MYRNLFVLTKYFHFYLENEVALLQRSFLCSQACFCHVLDEDLTAQLQSVLCRERRTTRIQSEITTLTVTI